MKLKSNIQLQYEGFLNTPLLWKLEAFEGLNQFELPPSELSTYNELIPDKIRLGKLVEHFVSHEFRFHKSISILQENLQIIEDKITLGEIDCLLRYMNELIHLEISYKFYLYDKDSGSCESKRWVGPNKKDSLEQKLSKLKSKQFPILFHNATIDLLDKLDIDVSKVEQLVYFKAQLFVPFSLKKKSFSEINNDCVIGFYIPEKELNQFKDYTFHIPSKLNWIIEPHIGVQWQSFSEFTTLLKSSLNNEKSPLCWLKDTNDKLEKFFVVWW